MFAVDDLLRDSRLHQVSWVASDRMFPIQKSVCVPTALPVRGGSVTPVLSLPKGSVEMEKQMICMKEGLMRVVGMSSPSPRCGYPVILPLVSIERNGLAHLLDGTRVFQLIL